MRFSSDIQLVELLKEITTEEEMLKRASFFTAGSHKKKLLVLRDRYKQRHNKVKEILAASDKEVYKKSSAEKDIKIGDLSLEAAVMTIVSLESISDDFQLQLSNEISNKENLNDTLAEKYKTEISALNEFIEDSIELEEAASEYSQKLTPAYNFFVEHAKIGIKLYNSFLTHITDKKEKEKFKSDFVFFASVRTEKQFKAYLNTNIINACKKKIKTEFDIILCDIYKHYWYLTLYSRYLSYGDVSKHSKYIYIDETQDLSPSEIELIYKINSVYENGISSVPVINAFGDINQAISSHSTHSWSEISFISGIHNLEENFRNPNQITRFCNKVLPFKMQEIGVDMDDVSVYSDWNELLLKCSLNLSGNTFIVKDDYYCDDLRHLLDISGFTSYVINTVKEIKGLEFKEVFVIDSEMTDNEKYIAYTRALKKLHVVSSIPVFVNRNTSLIVQGKET